MSQQEQELQELLETINKYAEELAKAGVWLGSKESIPFLSYIKGEKRAFYLYEFCCYLRIVVDLKENYRLKYIKGKGKFLDKFPKAPANKKGKPRVHAFENEKLVLQVCGGTKVKGRFASENCHPDISFQKGEASEDPSYKDLIMIHDAKFQEKPGSTLRKEEVYKFATIVSIYDLTKKGLTNVKFDRLKGLEGNCLLTNVKGHPQSAAFLKSEGIKEVVEFSEGKPVRVIP